MDNSVRFTFPVVSFRHLDTPFEKHGYRNFYAIVYLRQLPFF